MHGIKAFIIPIDPNEDSKQFTRMISFNEARIGSPIVKLVFRKALKDLLPQSTIDNGTPTGNVFWDSVLPDVDFAYKADTRDADCFGSVYGIPAYFEAVEEVGMVPCSISLYPERK